MTALIALASAVVIGGADFTGGLATRRDDPFRVTAATQLTSGAAAIVLASVVAAEGMETVDVVGGAIAGLSGTFSFVCFYRALSLGAMSLVAPVTAVVGAATPAVFGLARGEDLSAPTLVGLLVAVAAIGLVSRETPRGWHADRLPTAALVLAVVAGLGFSVFFIALSETNDEAGLWPLVVARAVSIPVVGVVAWRVAGRVAPVDRTARALALLTGVVEMLANALILVALRRGPIAVASVFGSLYPVSTVVLAWLLLRERVARAQVAGVGLAVVALVLVAV